MSRIVRALLVAATLLAAVPASAQIVGRPIEVSGRAGYSKPDDHARRQDGFTLGGSVGLRWLPYLTLEGHALFAPSKAETLPEPTANFAYAGLDLRWNLVEPERRVVPFLITGAGYGLSHTGGTPPDKLERGAASIGLGALWNVSNQRTFIRAEVRDVMFRERGPREFSNHLSASIGIHYLFGGRVKDSDLDRVRDWLDTCPDTPLGATVDKDGCPLDGDNDKVFDGLDNCPDTPVGCVVDSVGCSVDSDADGVCDGLDECPDTPAGADVDEKGCPRDSDGDGVLAGIDECPDTPQGCTVDATGCPEDADGDGVCDGLDECPNTPAGVKVNARGCPYELGKLEQQMLQTGRVRIQSVGFASGRGDLTPNVFPVLTELGQIVIQYPDLRFEFAGFTDDRGDTAAATRMSQARSNAVLLWFQRNVKGFEPSKFESVGRGADGVGDRARYVELRVLNPELLPAELEKRTPPETAPAPGAPPAEAPPDTSGGDREP